MTQTSERVVVGIDGSSCAEAALRWAERYAAMSGATLTLVAGWHWPMSYGVPIAYEGFDPAVDAKQILDEAARTLTLPARQVERSVIEGPAGNVLVEAAKDAALLVVGTRGHGAVASTILGSTSNYCAHHARCPIVIVR